MSTQLRIVETPSSPGRQPGAPSGTKPGSGGRRAAATGRRRAGTRGRRAHWNAEWRLDPQARLVGRAGVAAARAALAQAHLPEAS